MKLISLYFMVLIALIIGVLPGCSALPRPRLEAKRGILQGVLIESKRPQPKLIYEEYVIEPPDQLTVTVLGNPDLTQQTTVRPDGVISLDLIGTVPVGGMKVSEAEIYIEKKLSEYLKEVDVNIVVNTFASKNIYVMGKVGSQGPQPYTGKNNVLDALSRAGMFQLGASIQNVLIVRQDKVNPRVIPVNFKDLATKGIAAEDLLLKPNDIVLVTPNIFGRAEEILRTIVLPLGPATTPIFTLESLDSTFGLDLAGTETGTATSTTSAASSLAGATSAATTTAATTTSTSGAP